MRVITMSSSYGSGGSVIAPLLATRMSIPMLSSVRLEDRDHEGVDDVISESPRSGEDLTRSLWERILEAFASMPVEHGMVPTSVPADTSLRVKNKVEGHIKEFAKQPGGGVVLGWAGTAVLPDAFHVLLDGPIDRRADQAAIIEGVDVGTAQKRLEKSGEIRRVYWRRLYNQNWLDRSLFHLCLDSTAIDHRAAVEVIAAAASAYWEMNG